MVARVQSANVTGHMPSDVLVKEKERLNKDLEKAKLAYESEVTIYPSNLHEFTVQFILAKF